MTETGLISDLDPQETKEWLDAIHSVIRAHGVERAHFLIERISERATRDGMPLPYALNTPYRNTIAPENEAPMPGDRSEEHTSELQSRPHLVCRLLLEKKK